MIEQAHAVSLMHKSLNPSFEQKDSFIGFERDGSLRMEKVFIGTANPVTKKKAYWEISSGSLIEICFSLPERQENSTNRLG